ncbi:hypothetical protein AB0M95_34235 [Sphaerisporangium sp. NPDC051017]|uniref:hypothetical protein n=1 Tax=Sphaerisporangium sp. NPDC051017 TaxID=3154636 RepID=UPI003424167C
MDLLLGGFRLRLVSEHSKLREHVASVMVPPCATKPHRPGADWTVLMEMAEPPTPDEVEAVFSDRPVLAFPRSGPRLAVVDDGGGRLRVMVKYRPGLAACVMEVDAAGRTTRVILPAGDEVSVRCADWLVRVFFASRMLASGWHMLHASAVAVNGSAVLFLAGQGGGKSTLAHRACAEIGAAFLADDLILIGPDQTVVGWPTRVALPAALVSGSGEGCPNRPRVILSPSQHRVLLNRERSSPVPLGAVVSIVPTAGSEPLLVEQLHCLRSVQSAALDIPAQRLHTSDVLGLTGGPRPAGRNVPAAIDRVLLSGVPAASLRIGDLRTLHQAPVWDLLSDLLPLPKAS